MYYFFEYIGEVDKRTCPEIYYCPICKPGFIGIHEYTALVKAADKGEDTIIYIPYTVYKDNKFYYNIYCKIFIAFE